MRGAVLVLVLLVTLPLVPPLSAMAQGPVVVFISAPEVAGTGKQVPITVTVAGGPGEENGTFKIKVFLKGPDLQGASPLEDAPLEETSTDNTFSFNVTMPLTEQRVEVVVEANSTKGESWTVGSATESIDVLVPLEITATVVNQGDVEIRDVPVYLYLDGERVDETRLDSLSPGESKEIRFEYLPVGLGVGSHTFEIWVDLNGDGEIDPSLGELVYRSTFVKEAEPINPLYIVLGVVGAFVAALFVGAAIRQRRASRK